MFWPSPIETFNWQDIDKTRSFSLPLRFNSMLTIFLEEEDNRCQGYTTLNIAPSMLFTIKDSLSFCPIVLTSCDHEMKGLNGKISRRPCEDP
ncbi:hypothetical protein RRG08_003965 [Elysia crispata]|uniref:Uncharacterized protein n=1 Tax=Elysia crispata TaxID=231223 RepID=A0AAE1DFH6_9GAST|nr:hypothetical protein RRG08_003965 [Elysia crispata]